MRIVFAVLLAVLLPCSAAGQDLTPAEAKQQLQERGAGLSQSDYEGAILDGNEELVRLYLEAGYPPDGEIEVSSFDLSYIDATIRDHPEVLSLLLEYGADPNEPGFSAYPIGVAVPHFEPMQILLRHGADPSRAGTSGFKPIHSAVQKDTSRKVRVRAIRLLIRHGADVHAEIEKDATPLLLAAALGRPAAARVLLENGASPTRPGSSYEFTSARTLADVARKEGNEETAQVIEEYVE